MKLSTLRYFVAIAKYGSYTKASELLLISQPSLSRQIQDLEEELGVQLLVRDRKKVMLTEDGELLFHEASAIIERCDRLPDLSPDTADIENRIPTLFQHAMDLSGDEPHSSGDSRSGCASDTRHSRGIAKGTENQPL